MNRICLTALSCLLLSNVVMAALPPTAESFRQMKAILDSKEVYNKLGSANWIESMSNSGEKYLLRSEKCRLEVIVRPVEHNTTEFAMIGPRPLEVKVGELVCE